MPYMYFIKQVCSIKFPLWAVHYKGYKTNVYKNNEIFMESYNFLCIVFFFPSWYSYLIINPIR